MKIEEIFNEWENDCNLDVTDIGRESTKIPKLHHKYFRIFSDEKLKLKLLETEYNILLKQKHEYYNGLMTNEELKSLGWPPNPLKILKSDVPLYINADQDIIKANIKLASQKEKVDLLDSIIKSFVSRGYNLKTALDWLKFTNGC